MTTERPTYQDRIVTVPDVRAGAATIKGTRISVERILGRLAVNPDAGALVADYPELTIDDVKAALAYAYDVLADAKQREAARDRRFRRMLAVPQRNPEVDGDALLEELEREDAAERARIRS